ncbi:MAG: hypothetical protein PHP14_02460 [Candidatus Pacebacteria bacterium]|nr:hypothetical protein [Candidatus Paceibacterota bacterium]MDD3808485.1 hypothetical protein [Candidatus Paceibacterota bacterium]
MKRILIDVGSSTVKVYKLDDEILSLVLQKSIPFKNGFDNQKGLSEQSKKELFNLLNIIKIENHQTPISIYATALFRKLLPEPQKNFVNEVLKLTGLHFNIISQELESHYLEKALLDKCFLSDQILIINIGGGSTELIIVNNKQVVDRYNIDFGVSTVINNFPGINESISAVDIDTVINYVKNLLPYIKTNPQIAFYTGGELNYMILTKYTLTTNTLFQDNDHPFMIGLKEFQIKNEAIYKEITLKELEELMPENPK